MPRVGLINTVTDVFVGSEQYPDRKRPALIVQRGSQAVVIGYFKSAECVDVFKEALHDVLNKPKEDA